MCVCVVCVIVCALCVWALVKESKEDCTVVKTLVVKTLVVKTVVVKTVVVKAESKGDCTVVTESI